MDPKISRSGFAPPPGWLHSSRNRQQPGSCAETGPLLAAEPNCWQLPGRAGRVSGRRGSSAPGRGRGNTVAVCPHTCAHGGSQQPRRPRAPRQGWADKMRPAHDGISLSHKRKGALTPAAIWTNPVNGMPRREADHGGHLLQDRVDGQCPQQANARAGGRRWLPGAGGAGLPAGMGFLEGRMKMFWKRW